MKHANEVEEEEKWQAKLAEYKQKMGIAEDTESKNESKNKETGKNLNLSIVDTIKQIFLKPYAWIFASILVFSPYGTEILKLIFQYFGGK